MGSQVAQISTHPALETPIIDINGNDNIKTKFSKMMLKFATVEPKCTKKEPKRSQRVAKAKMEQNDAKMNPK